MNAETIAGKSFPTVRKGFDPDEVRSYLRMLATDLVAVVEDNDALRSEILRLESDLEHTRAIEGKVRGMLNEIKAASKKMVGQAEASAAAMSYKVEQERKAIVEEARREAAVIIRDAERRAERQLMKGNARMDALREQIDLLETKKLALITRIKSILRSQVDFLTALEQPRGGSLRTALTHATHTREGLDVETLDDIIERLDDREEDA